MRAVVAAQWAWFAMRAALSDGAPSQWDASLERDLEQLIERGLGSTPAAPRTSPRHRSRSPVQVPQRHGAAAARIAFGGSRPSLDPPQQVAPTRRSPQVDSRGDLPEKLEPGNARDLLAKAEDRHAAAKVKLTQVLALRDRQLEDSKQRQQRQLEAATSLERAEKDLHCATEHVERAEEHASWLSDIIVHCEKAEAKKVFEGSVVAIFSEAVAKLSQAGELQRTQAQEADGEHRRATAAKELASRELAEHAAGLAEIQAAVRRSEEEAQAGQLSIASFSQQAKHLSMVAQAEDEAVRLRRAAEHAEKQARESSSTRDAARQQLGEHRAWTEDLQLFFKGNQPRDSNSILRGLQVLLPSDTLPTIVRAMLSEKRIDVNSSTVRSVNSMVTEHVKVAEASLRENVKKQEAICQEREGRLAGASHLLHQQEAQVKGLLSQAGARGIATPLRNAGVEVPKRSSSGGAPAPEVAVVAGAKSRRLSGEAATSPPRRLRPLRAAPNAPAKPVAR